ncbi:unnamed protein product, partial [Iphiclides podalirius]
MFAIRLTVPCEQLGRSPPSAVPLARGNEGATNTRVFSIQGCFLPYTDFSPDDWGPEFPLSTPSRYTIPMPTLYSTEGYKYKKPSIIELVLYNMAALLGGVAAGYDVRVSNVSPLHPTLQPHRAETEPEPPACPFEGYGFAHNTYHGPARHLRAPLNAITGSPLSMAAEEARPLRFTDSPGHYAPSATSGLGSGCSASPSATSRRTPPAADHLADLYHNYREHFQPAPARDRPYHGHDECSFDCLAHRRTPSNSSAANSHGDDFSPPPRPYRPERCRPPRGEYPRKSTDYSLPRDYYRHESLERVEPERPANLGLELAPTRLRSSLKKGSGKKSSASGGSSGGGTPTNPTPPDSWTSETDSSYVSARDASSGSQSRVRFSPETMEGPSRLS